jgi:hypothetical protein
MDYFYDVPPRTPPTHCAKCRKQFARGDVIIDVKLVSGIGQNPSGVGKCVYLSIYEEFAHFECADPKLERPFLDTARSTLLIDVNQQPVVARAPDFVCARCREKLKREDRIITCALVEGIFPDERGIKSVRCSAEFEVVHVDCRDRDLTGGR